MDGIIEPDVCVWLSRKLVAGIGRDEGGGSCGDLWPEEDVVSEVVEAADEVGRGARPCLLIKEGLSERDRTLAFCS